MNHILMKAVNSAMLVLVRSMPFNGSRKNCAKVSRSKIIQLLGFFFLYFREKLAANTAPTTNILALCCCPNPGRSVQPRCTVLVCSAFEEWWQSQCTSTDLIYPNFLLVTIYTLHTDIGGKNV